MYVCTRYTIRVGALHTCRLIHVSTTYMTCLDTLEDSSLPSTAYIIVPSTRTSNENVNTCDYMTYIHTYTYIHT